MSQVKFTQPAFTAMKQHRPRLSLSRTATWASPAPVTSCSTTISHISRTRRQFHAFRRLAEVQREGGERSTTNNATTSGHGDIDGLGRPKPTFSSIRQRREAAGRLIAPTASYSDSDMFKDPGYRNLPKALRWDDHLTAEALSRQPPVLKQAVKALGKPGLISLGGGIPTAKNFPINRLHIRVPTGVHGFSESQTAARGRAVVTNKYDVLNATAALQAREKAQQELCKKEVAADTFDAQDKESNKDEAFKNTEYDLSIALNYSQSTGAAQLLRFVTEHTELVSNPRYADWRCSLTIGSTGALEQAFRMLLDGHRRDALLTEEFSFATALETARPLGVGVFGIPMDEQGLLPEAMDDILTNWDEESRGGKRKPHVLYTVPSGQNPTGATQGTKRRRDVYEVCKKHDVFIVEDEPYYFLHMPPYNSSSATDAVDSASIDTNIDTSRRIPVAQDFLNSLPPTLLSLDTDGRVLRLDSFSKTLIPGSRVGWITASEQITEQYIRHAECASQGPSGISQLVLHMLVDRTWGHDGFLRWLRWLARQYTKRRDVLVGACEKELGSLKTGVSEGRGLVKWTIPRAGMFLWLEIDHTAHPDIATKSIMEIEEEIYEACISHGVLACRGSWFRAEPEKPLKGLFFRTTYAAAPEEDMIKAVERFGTAVREVFRIEG